MCKSIMRKKRGKEKTQRNIKRLNSQREKIPREKIFLNQGIESCHT